MEAAPGAKSCGKGGPTPPPTQTGKSSGRGGGAAAAARPAAPGGGLADLLAARRSSLRRTTPPREQLHLVDVSEQSAAHRQRYFASAADRWLFEPGVAEWTFPTCFLELTAPAARDLVAGAAGTPALRSLEAAIDAEMRRRGWPRSFAKLTTFSPKDSPLVLEAARARLLERPGVRGPAALRALGECMTEALGISGGAEATRLLGSSERVKCDLQDALASQGEKEPTPVPSVCLRSWSGALPVWSEFRGFVWQGQLNAVGQYVYNICFEELQDEATLKRIEADILEAWRTLGPLLVPTQPTCIVDFAWSPDGFAWAGGRKVILIEVNPFDGVNLGMGELTTGIFKLRDNASDLEIVKSGPFELRVKRDAMSEEDFQAIVRGLPSKQREVFERLEAAAR
uniref:Cell division cycle protein 123 homolog n=1 Tax=Alexandrium monilatum TaxID=311494 RepID=A0A7S4RD41_9DINO